MVPVTRAVTGTRPPTIASMNSSSGTWTNGGARLTAVEPRLKAAEANAAVSIENANASPTLVRSSVHERLHVMPRAVAANEAIAGGGGKGSLS